MTCFKKKTFRKKKRVLFFFINFQSIISLNVLKLALNKSLHASDDEQGINKLWPYIYTEISTTYTKIMSLQSQAKY